MSQNKIALITGGSRGLGKEMAFRIAEKGLDVVITYNSKKEEAEAVVSEIEKSGQKALALQLDVSDSKNFDSFFSQLKTALKEKFGVERFDYLVNNAGIGINAPIAEMNETDFDTLVNIQFKAPFFLTQKSLELMNDGGGIVNISSGLARFSMLGYGVYGALKGAVEVLTRYEAQEFGKRGINVNVVAPGAIETDFGGGVVRDNVQINQHIAGTTALGRVGLPSDIGGVVAFLCTDDAKWINAQRIEVSGGVNL